MNIEHSGVTYEIIMGSDIVRDGMYLELRQSGTNSPEQVAEIFYSDVSHEFAISCFTDNVPLPVIEALIKEAKERLPADLPEELSH